MNAIIDKWAVFERECVGPGANARQRECMKFAFFGGFAGSLQLLGETGAMSHAARSALWDSWNAEIEAYVSSIDPNLFAPAPGASDAPRPD